MDYVPVPTGRPIVFYSPHQDDETLFMGRVIARHALAGREVHVVLVTDGRASGARHVLNGDVASNWWPGAYHYPAREGYQPLTPEVFSAARTAEFRSACGQLGVQPANVHVEPYPDSTLTPTQAAAVIEKYQAIYPTAGHYTMSWEDATNDHSILGEALRDLATADPATYDDVRWLIKPENAHLVPGAATYYIPPALAEVHAMVARAARCYEAWSPAGGSFAVGYHSVGVTYFSGVEAGAANWIHSL